MWLSVDNIKEKDDCVIAELPDVPQLVGSGQSVGGVVSETVGASSVGNNPPLQVSIRSFLSIYEILYQSFSFFFKNVP